MVMGRVELRSGFAINFGLEKRKGKERVRRDGEERVRRG